MALPSVDWQNQDFGPAETLRRDRRVKDRRIADRRKEDRRVPERRKAWKGNFEAEKEAGGRREKPDKRVADRRKAQTRKEDRRKRGERRGKKQRQVLRRAEDMLEAMKQDALAKKAEFLDEKRRNAIIPEGTAEARVTTERPAKRVPLTNRREDELTDEDKRHRAGLKPVNPLDEERKKQQQPSKLQSFWKGITGQR